MEEAVLLLYIFFLCVCFVLFFFFYVVDKIARFLNSIMARDEILHLLVSSLIERA